MKFAIHFISRHLQYMHWQNSFYETWINPQWCIEWSLLGLPVWAGPAGETAGDPGMVEDWHQMMESGRKEKGHTNFMRRKWIKMNMNQSNTLKHIETTFILSHIHGLLGNIGYVLWRIFKGESLWGKTNRFRRCCDMILQGESS